jgi:preprotein translocase subunit Sec63
MKNNEEIASSNLKEKRKKLEMKSVHPKVAKPGDNTKKASFELTEAKIAKTYEFVTRKN